MGMSKTERHVRFLRDVNDARRSAGTRLDGGVGAHTLQLTKGDLIRARERYGQEVLHTEDGWKQLHDEGRHMGLTGGTGVPGLRNRFGRVTWSRRYGRTVGL